MTLPTPERLEKVQRLVSHRQQGVIVLEDLYDPHNAAAVLRTCDALGFHTVYYIFENQTVFNPRKVGKSSSSSANKWLDIHTFTSTKACLTQLKNDGYTLFGTMLRDDNATLSACDFTAPKTALLFGNEHKGLSDTAKAMCDVAIKIPMAGMVESFNISVCAALCMYEVTRQREQAGVVESCRFTEEQQATFANQLLNPKGDEATEAIFSAMGLKD